MRMSECMYVWTWISSVFDGVCKREKACGGGV